MNDIVALETDAYAPGSKYYKWKMSNSTDSPDHETAIVSITWSDRDFTPDSNDVMKCIFTVKGCETRNRQQ